MATLSIDEVLPELVLSELVTYFAPVDFESFSCCSKKCRRVCKFRTHEIRSFTLESGRYLNGKIEYKGTEDERTYYISREGDIRLPKIEHSKTEIRVFELERGVEHFFSRFSSRRPDHVSITACAKFLGEENTTRVFNVIKRLYNGGLRFRCRKLTCFVDTADRVNLITKMFECVKYDIHGCGSYHINIPTLSENVRKCKQEVAIDQFAIDIRQLNAERITVWETTLNLDEFKDFCREKTKQRCGLVMHFNVTHNEPADLDEVISQERKRINPKSTPFKDYTAYISKVRSCTHEGDGYLSTVQFRWHVL